MGRKKIQITRIQDERNRQITFSKRKAGLLKKAYELSILCDVDIAVIMITHNSKLYQYASSNMNSILIRYTEFKDPDESKTNADILEEITKKEKSGRGDDSGEDEDPTAQIPLTPNTQAHYQRIDEEFDHVLHHSELPQPHPPPLILPSKVPQSMPVSVPVTSAGGSVQRLSSTGSSDSPISSTTPGSVKTPHSTGGLSMPPPAGTPTRLQAIRSQTLKLHLPGSGRNYIPLASGGSSSKSPMADNTGIVGGDSTKEQNNMAETEVSIGRPQLRVVIPGQKGFVSRSVPSSPPITVNMGGAGESPTTPPVIIDATDSPPPPDPAQSVDGSDGKAVVATHHHILPSQINTDSLTTPIMSLTTPNIFNSLAPGLSNLSVDIPNLGESGSTSALVAFPVSIQPSSIGNTPGTSNIILQAQNMGQPFLLAQTSHDKQHSFHNQGSAGGSSSSLTPSSGGSMSSLRDLEQLKLQYDKIYQQISQTLQQHQATFTSSSKEGEEVGIGEKRSLEADSEGLEDMSSSKRINVETTAD